MLPCAHRNIRSHSQAIHTVAFCTLVVHSLSSSFLPIPHWVSRLRILRSEACIRTSIWEQKRNALCAPSVLWCCVHRTTPKSKTLTHIRIATATRNTSRAPNIMVGLLDALLLYRLTNDQVLWSSSECISTRPPTGALIPQATQARSHKKHSTTAQVDRQQKGTINFRRCSEKDTIYIPVPKQWKTYNKKVRFIFRSQNPQKVRLFRPVRLLGFCW